MAYIRFANVGVVKEQNGMVKMKERSNSIFIRMVTTVSQIIIGAITNKLKSNPL
jgi:hypothetical protein